MRIYQLSCREGKSVDPRQAAAILRHKPDLVFREAPSKGRGAFLVFDPRRSVKEQRKALRTMSAHLYKVAKKDPWVVSDISMFQNAVQLLEDGHKIKIYNVDAPSDLLKETIKNKWNLIAKPRRRGVHLLWWVYIYLRERIMSKNMEPPLGGQAETALVFMQKFHWLNVKFLLSGPTKDEIWEYYFGKFKMVNRKNISALIKEENQVLYQYWKKFSDFQSATIVPKTRFGR